MEQQFANIMIDLMKIYWDRSRIINTPNGLLRISCEDGDIDGVKRALASPDVDVNEKSAPPHSQTPLHLAAMEGHLHICKLLLKQKNIDRYAVNGSGMYQPVHEAAMNGYVDIVRLFLAGKSLARLGEEEINSIRKFFAESRSGLRWQLCALFSSNFCLTQKLLHFVTAQSIGEAHIRNPGYMLQNYDYPRLLYSLTSDRRHGLITILIKLAFDWDKYLINDKATTSLIRDLFQAVPTIRGLTRIMNYADAITCDAVTSIALRRCDDSDDILSICSTYVLVGYRDCHFTKQLTPTAKEVFNIICEPPNIVKVFEYDITYAVTRHKKIIQLIDFHYKDIVLPLLLSICGDHRIVETAAQFGVRNTLKLLLQSQGQNIDKRQFDVMARQSCLQDLEQFAMLCKHSSYQYSKTQSSEFAAVRHQCLQSNKDNYCLSKTNSIQADDDEVIFKAAKLIDEVRHQNFKAETEEIKKALLLILIDIAKAMPIPFEPQIVGSSHEGTRNFVPNEFDVLCIYNKTRATISEGFFTEMHYQTDFDVESFIESFYIDFLSTLKQCVTHSNKYDLEYLPSTNVGYYNGLIQNFTFRWTGAQLPGLIIHVDIVPVLRCSLPDPTRRMLNQSEAPLLLAGKRKIPKRDKNELQVCVSHTESDFIRQLPVTIRNGYKIAKALRSATLFPHTTVKFFRMASDLPLNEYLKTYWLKHCLFYALITKDGMITVTDQAGNKNDELYWTDKIYGTLEGFLRQGFVPWLFSFHSSNILFFCSKVQRKLKLGFDKKCCLQRKFLLKVVTWIRYLIASVRAAEENQSVVGKVMVYSRDTMKHPYDFYNIYMKHAQPLEIIRTEPTISSRLKRKLTNALEGHSDKKKKN